MIKRARGVLAELEASKRPAPRSARPTRCRCSRRAEEAPAPEPEPDALREALAALDADAMWPREALPALYELKRL